MKRQAYLVAAMIAAACVTASARPAVVNRAVALEEVLAAQQRWCDALIEISAIHAREGVEAACARAEALIDAAYGYSMGVVLFKSTLTTAPHTFRTTREGALSYFVGGNPNFPADTGFALLGWTHCEVENAAVFIEGDTATTMGKVRLTNADGKTTTVDKTWQFAKDDAGALKIIVHHSSLEYSAP
jgi:hypothetical protein